jgi:hypothetical protein
MAVLGMLSALCALSLAGPDVGLIARADTFEIEWTAAAAYHVEQLDVLANDTSTGLRITNIIPGAEMVGKLSIASPNDYGLIYM